MTRAAQALDAVGLAHRLTHLPGQLSGGEQQRVALARAFAPRPRLLLADEPTGNLDQATGDAVMDLLFRLRAETGTTLLLITHDAHLAARCTRRIHLADGTGNQGRTFDPFPPVRWTVTPASCPSSPCGRELQGEVPAPPKPRTPRVSPRFAQPARPCRSHAVGSLER